MTDARRWAGSTHAARLRLSPDAWALVAITVVVLLANAPYLLGVFDPNPLHFRAGLTSAITHGWLSGKPTIDPSNGFTSQAIGHLAALEILHLHLPWWNPYEGTGMALAGETQSAALFPPTLLTAFSNGQLYEHVLFELIAGISTFYLLRRISLSRPAAIAGAIAFALNGKFAWFADAGVNPVPFLPLLLLGIERAFAAARDGRRAGWRLIAVAGALSAYAGFPEVAYIDAVVAVFWIGWRGGCLERSRLRPFATKLVLGVAAGTLVAAPILVAMATYLPHANLGVHTGTKLANAHLAPSSLPQLLLPYVYGQVNADPHAFTWLRVGGYLSTTLLLLAVLGVMAPGRRGLKLVLLGLGLLVFARMYGQPPLLGRVIGLLPGMSRIQFFRYGTAALELPVIVLAALGVDDLVRVPEHRRRLLWAGLGVLAVVLVAALDARPVVHSLGTQFDHPAFFHASIVWGALVVVALAAVAFVRRTQARAAALIVIVAVDAVVLFAVPEFSAPRATTVDLAPVTYLRQHLGEGRFFTLGPIQPDYGSYFRLASIGVDDFPPKSYATFVRRRLDPGVVFTGFRPAGRPSAQTELMRHLAGYRATGVRYVLTPARGSLPQSPSGLQLVFRSPSSNIYRLAGAAPYYSAAGCQVASSERSSAQLDCTRSATLIRRETSFPGWSAAIDGHSAPIHEVDGIFQAVTVAPGRHRVTFGYTPPGMAWAGLALLAGIALMCVPTALGRRVRHPDEPRERSSAPTAGPVPAA